MTVWWLAFILGSLFAVLGGFAWIIIELRAGRAPSKGKRTVSDLDKAYSDVAEEDVSHLFNKEFREELRNRGRLRLEKVLDENAMFLKQDIDLTISQINEYLKQAIVTNLDKEFTNYTKSLDDAQQLAVGVLQRTVDDVEQQRQALAATLSTSLAAREDALVKLYQDNMAKIVEHYVLQALGDQFDMRAQLPYILQQMENNKQAIIEDMRA